MILEAILIIVLIYLIYKYNVIQDVKTYFGYGGSEGGGAKTEGVESYNYSGLPREETKPAGLGYDVGPREIFFHYTDWCPACQNMKPIIKQLELSVKGIANIRWIDEDKAKTPSVRKYPTIRMRITTGELIEYAGPADYNELQTWVTAKMSPNVRTSR